MRMGHIKSTVDLLSCPYKINNTHLIHRQAFLFANDLHDILDAQPRIHVQRNGLACQGFALKKTHAIKRSHENVI